MKLSNLMDAEIAGRKNTNLAGVQHNPEGIDYIPSDIELANMDVKLVNTMCQRSSCGTHWPRFRTSTTIA